ncbi:hypothetical protein GGX14DRAFT_596581 [Mycena pura]|uniref:Immunoreactive mannoprotein MP88 n=1 Tax=Mycena pura TaxID=153505 RepID=A0AAD6UPZ0_9AGAR|nr:hypothetical protein GGX14DRAFT_596581 [Mycena pura]
MFLSALLLAAHITVYSTAARSNSFPAGVIATGTQGATNPPVPTLPTTIDQTSMARLLSINSIDDFCIFAPPSLATIPDTESVEVAWCTMPRNNARVIPDGTFTGLSFLKTDFYVQIFGFGDLTKINVAPNDAGGELDPHGATGAGNPVGGNVSTTVINAIDEPIAEWMLFIDNEFFCLRACTNANATYSAAFMCWHELDEMGCEFVMPGTYHTEGGIFETCDADVAYPPGWYPEVTDGTTTFSTFAQFATGVFTGGDGRTTSFTVGDTVTPAAPFSTPSSSNCVTQATISNGIPLASLTPGAKGTAPPPGFSSSTAAPSTSSSLSGSAISNNPSSSAVSASVLVLVSASASASESAPSITAFFGSTSGPSLPVPTSSSAAPRAVSIGCYSDFEGVLFISALATLTSIVLFH